MTGITRAMAARIIAGYFGTQATYVGGQYDAYSIRDSDDRQWKIVSDSSIRPESGRDTRPNQNYRVEFVSPICVYPDIETIQEIIRSLRAGGAKVNDSCGIHVHVDASTHNVKTLRNIVNITRIVVSIRTSLTNPYTAVWRSSIRLSKTMTMKLSPQMTKNSNHLEWRCDRI